MTTSGKASGHGKAQRRTKAKGRRPSFFDDPNVDKLLAIIAALSGEVAVLRQRLDTHERLAAARGLYTPADIEAYVTTVEDDDERAHWRAEFLARVFRVLEFSTAADELRAAEQDYDQMISSFAPAASARDSAGE